MSVLIDSNILDKIVDESGMLERVRGLTVDGSFALSPLVVRALTLHTRQAATPPKARRVRHRNSGRHLTRVALGWLGDVRLGAAQRL